MEGFSCPAQELHQLDNMWAKLAESSLCVHHILIARRRNKRHFVNLVISNVLVISHVLMISQL